MPNLIRLGNDSFGNFIFEDGITYVDLAYYFKILKEYSFYADPKYKVHQV